MVAAVRVHKTGGPEVLTYEDVRGAGAGTRPDQDQEPRLRRQFHRHLFPHGHVSLARRLAVRLRQRGGGRSHRGRARRDRHQGRRPRRLYVGARGLCGRAHAAGRPGGEAPGQDQLRAGRRHDAQGHDGAISAAADLQGAEGRQRAHPRRRRRRRADRLPMGEPSRRQRHRHRRLEGQGRARQEERRPPRHPLSRRGFRRQGQGDHRRQAVRGGL